MQVRDCFLLGGLALGTAGQTFEPADFNVTKALLGQGVNISALPGLSALVERSSNLGCSIACNSLKLLYGGNAVETADEASYDDFTASYWSLNQANLNPYCIFKPSTTSAVSVLVLLSRLTQCPFAVKSGGHAAFAGASSIEGGITVALQNLNSIKLSSDNAIASVQPGNTWATVYSTLETFDLAVIGGRVEKIGVGGLTLGGGISFFSSIYGWACDNVASYDVVTASGIIITASPNQYSDLYWALRGSGNNFGVVVGFNLETISLVGGEMWGGSRVYMEDSFSAVIDAFVGLVADSSQDPKAGVWVAWLVDGGVPLVSAELWYAKPDGEDAAIFDKFNNITFIVNTTQNRVLSEYTVELQASNPYGYREVYYATSVKASAELVTFTKDIFFEELPAISSLAGANSYMLWQGITTGELQAMTKNGGNPLGLSAADGPLYLVQLGCWWDNEEDDAVIYLTFSTILERIKEEATSLKVQNDYVYMNYGSQYQDVISSYGAEQKAKLQSIAQKYDPAQVFQTLQPGGFKLDRAPVPDSGYFSF